MEFALIVPFMLVLYLLSMEFSLAIEVSKKVNRVAWQIGNLVTQTSSITREELGSIARIGDATLQPFRETPDVTITALEVTEENKAPVAKVVWSQKWNGEKLEKAIEPGTVVKDVPETYMVLNSFLIRTTADLDYYPLIAPAKGSSLLGISDKMFPIKMSEQLYTTPRRGGLRIECTDC